MKVRKKKKLDPNFLYNHGGYIIGDTLSTLELSKMLNDLLDIEHGRVVLTAILNYLKRELQEHGQVDIPHVGRLYISQDMRVLPDKTRVSGRQLNKRKVRFRQAYTINKVLQLEDNEN